MTFEIVQGDLFDPVHKFDALAQGVNTYGIMGAGIAVPFRTRWPAMYEEYHQLCLEHQAILPGLMHVWDGFDVVIYNLFSQVSPGKDGKYDMLSKATWLMKQDTENRWSVLKNQPINRVGMPWVGCGIAGLAKHNVEYIFRRILTDSPVEFVLVEQ